MAQKTKLVISNATTFFTGRIEAIFQKAKKYDFQYLEILPYHWTTAQEILALEKKYDVEVVGIHLPSPWKTTFNPTSIAINAIIAFYIGIKDLNPGIQIARALSLRHPYLLFHSNLASKNKKQFDEAKRIYNAVIENIPKEPAMPAHFWDPELINQTAPVIFDPAHYGMKQPDLLAKYGKIKPLGIHLAFDHGFPFYHDIPNTEETALIKEMLQIHAPEYLILECYPWANIAKGKEIMDYLIA